MIKLYNTLTKQKEILKTIEENKVRMYVCGPTVYNYIHIGNARPIIVFDVVRKYLEHSGYEVDFISNFTDVEGGYSHEKKRMIIVVIQQNEMHQLRKLVAKNCPDAFITVSAVNTIVGNFKEHSYRL